MEAPINGRVAFMCADAYASRAILGQGGAEKLAGNGAIMFKSAEHTEAVYLQGAAMPTSEIDKFVAHVAAQPHDLSNKFIIGETELLQATVFDAALTESVPAQQNTEDHKLVEVILWALGQERVSALKITDIFRVDNKAREFVERLCDMKIVGEKYGNLPRTVLPTSADDVQPDVMEFLARHGIDADAINKAIANRGKRHDERMVVPQQA